MAKQVLIVGAGPAGLAAAEAASSLGARVTLCGAEPYAPYWRPRLTRCLSEPAEAALIAIRKPEWYAQRGIALVTGQPASRIDPAARLVHWDGAAEPTAYDTLVLATGASPNAPAIPGAGRALTLRSYDDAVKIRREALAAGRAVVVGGGLLGLETAWELKSAGAEVCVVERGQWLMPRQLNRAAGLYLQMKLEASGITLLAGCDPKDPKGFYAGACVVLAAGVSANLSLAASCGILVNRGILVDERMATSAPGIYACGDAAEFNCRSWGLLPVAQEQGKVAGANAAGGEAVYVEAPPSPMLKAGPVSVFSIGDVSQCEGVVSLEQQDEGGYACLMLREGVLTGAVLVGNTSAGVKLRKALAEKRSYIGMASAGELLAAL